MTRLEPNCCILDLVHVPDGARCRKRHDLVAGVVVVGRAELTIDRQLRLNACEKVEWIVSAEFAFTISTRLVPAV